MRRGLLLLLLSCGRTEVVSPGVAMVGAAPPVTAAPEKPVSCRDTTPPSCARCGSMPIVSCGVPPPTCAPDEQPEVAFCDGGMCAECSPHFSGRCVPCMP